jgi:hypothetical protein
MNEDYYIEKLHRVIRQDGAMAINDALATLKCIAADARKECEEAVRELKPPCLRCRPSIGECGACGYIRDIKQFYKAALAAIRALNK